MYIIAGTHKKRMIFTPKGYNTRPTASRLREALFNICQLEVEDSIFLDLFAGTGAMGLEALSRGATRAVFVDHNRESIRAINRNIEEMQLKERSQVIADDVLKTIKRLESHQEGFNIIYVDPPYEANTILLQQILEFFDRSPLLREGGSLFFEEDHRTLKEPRPEQMYQLRLMTARRMGRSALYHYRKLPKGS